MQAEASMEKQKNVGVGPRVFVKFFIKRDQI